MSRIVAAKWQTLEPRVKVSANERGKDAVFEREDKTAGENGKIEKRGQETNDMGRVRKGQKWSGK